MPEQLAMLERPQQALDPEKLARWSLAWEATKRQLAYRLAIKTLEDDPSGLRDAWYLYLDAYPTKDCGRWRCQTCPRENCQRFVDETQKILGYDGEIIVCDMCFKPEWDDDAYADIDGHNACEPCRDERGSCERCSDWSISEDFLQYVDGYGYCESCFGDIASFCDECDVYYFNDRAYEHDHDSWCQCAPQRLDFTMPARDYTLQQDERIEVELAKGFINEQATDAVVSLLWNEQFRQIDQDWRNALYVDHRTPRPEGYMEYHEVQQVVESLERVWQAKQGNWTRRLSKAFYEKGVKLNPGVLAKAGTTVKAHAGGNTNKWFVEFTRDLNQPPGNFYHEDSCWWGGENQSLCALKHWGGLGMRSYEDETARRDYPTGRAWVQPLDKDMRPTADVEGAHAYVVYNGYGELSGYTPARLVAHLTSKTYKKIEFSANYQYVNCGGYLVADQETCNATDEVYIGSGLDSHQKVAA